MRISLLYCISHTKLNYLIKKIFIVFALLVNKVYELYSYIYREIMLLLVYLCGWSGMYDSYMICHGSFLGNMAWIIPTVIWNGTFQGDMAWIIPWWSGMDNSWVIWHGPLLGDLEWIIPWLAGMDNSWVIWHGTFLDDL